MLRELEKPEEGWGPAYSEHYREFVDYLRLNPNLDKDRRTGLFQSDIYLIRQLAAHLAKQTTASTAHRLYKIMVNANQCLNDMKLSAIDYHDD